MARWSPTLTQQKGFAYAPIPFAAVSFLSSSFVIYYLLFRERHLLQRLYHRLVLAMNFALLPVSFVYMWSTAAMPVGTPNFVGTRGTVNTCTASGVIGLVFPWAVATYYASLALQALLGIRNNFKEEKYRWIEIIIHLVAYLIPCVFAAIVAAAENFNPLGTTCFVTQAPLGCDDDPDVECERGKGLQYVPYIIGISQMFLYFIYPPVVILAMHLWLSRTSKKILGRCSGMSIMRETTRKEMMRSVHRQISVYLLSFWSTWVLTLGRLVYQGVTGKRPYNLGILSNCIFALQGFVFMVVYFTLQKEIFDFNIFDGESDPDSPWTMFFDQDDCSEEEGALDEEGLSLPNDQLELANEQHGS